MGVTWKKRTSYSIQQGPYIICKTVHEHGDVYTLWRNHDRLGNYHTADEAKEAAILENDEV